MTRSQIDALRREVERIAAAGGSRNVFREWADAYFGIQDLYEVVKLMVDELEGCRQRFEDGKPPSRN